MSYLITKDDGSKYLIHYGIQGQRWGIRNFQNEDGSLTPEGRERYRKTKDKLDKSIFKSAKTFNKSATKKYKKARINETYTLKEYSKDLDSNNIVPGSKIDKAKRKEALKTERYKKNVEYSNKLDILLNNPESEEYQNFKNRYAEIKNERTKQYRKSAFFRVFVSGIAGIIIADKANQKFDEEFFKALDNIPMEALDKLDKN